VRIVAMGFWISRAMSLPLRRTPRGYDQKLLVVTDSVDGLKWS